MFREALPVVAVAFCVCFGFGNKVSRSRRLPSTRARTRLSNRRVSLLFCASLPFCFFPEKKENSQPGGTFSCHRPGRGSSAGCYSPWLPEERGMPLAPGGLGRPHRQPPDNFEAPPASTEKSGRARARTRRATGTSSDVQPARFAACNRHVYRRATGASRGAQPARLAACNQHVSAACILRRPAHPDACKGARSRASNHNPSPLGSAAGKVCDLAKC